MENAPRLVDRDCLCPVGILLIIHLPGQFGIKNINFKDSVGNNYCCQARVQNCHPCNSIRVCGDSELHCGLQWGLNDVCVNRNLNTWEIDFSTGGFDTAFGLPRDFHEGFEFKHSFRFSRGL